MIEPPRYVQLAGVLDRIAEIDPSARPAEACPDCGSFTCEHCAAPMIDAYTERYRLVLHAMHLAAELGFAAGVGYDKAAIPGWPVFYIELPTGQVSWHMPAHPNPFDGHTTADKYERIANFGGMVRS